MSIETKASQRASLKGLAEHFELEASARHNQSQETGEELACLSRETSEALHSGSVILAARGLAAAGELAGDLRVQRRVARETAEQARAVEARAREIDWGGI